MSPGGGGQNESQIWKCFIPVPPGKYADNFTYTRIFSAWNAFNETFIQSHFLQK